MNLIRPTQSRHKRSFFFIVLILVVGVLGACAALAAGEDLERDAGSLHQKLNALGAALGIGNLSGFGLPIVILLIGTLKFFHLEPGWLESYVVTDSILYSGPSMILAGIMLAIAVVAGNEKLSKSIKLPAQIVGIPPATAFAFFAPILAAVGPETRTAWVVDASGTTVPSSGLATLGFSWLLLLGVVSAAAATLVLMARLMLAFTVWVSPFPFVDGLLNIGFHIYAAIMIALCIFAPPIGLAAVLLQTVVLLLCISWLWRCNSAAFSIITGRFRAFGGGEVKATPWMEKKWSKAAVSDVDRQLAAYVSKPSKGLKSHAAVALGVRAGELVISAKRKSDIAISSMVAGGLHIRSGFLLDELRLDDTSKNGEPIEYRFFVTKDWSNRLATFADELREEGFVPTKTLPVSAP